MSERKTLEELVNLEDPFMTLLHEWSADAPRDVEILPAAKDAGERTLVTLQVTTRSPLGAIAYETGGLLIDRGWLRVLGAGSSRLARNVADWNRLEQSWKQHRLPGACLIADDAIGGFYAINAGALPGDTGNVFYLAPDICEWEDMEMGHTAWLHWAITRDLDDYYETMRWAGWPSEVAEIVGDQGIAIYPPLWAKGEPLEGRSRRPVPIEELWGLHAVEFPKQLGVRARPGED